jgi:hypothetical protein
MCAFHNTGDQADDEVAINAAGTKSESSEDPAWAAGDDEGEEWLEVTQTSPGTRRDELGILFHLLTVMYFILHMHYGSCYTQFMIIYEKTDKIPMLFVHRYVANDSISPCNPPQHE